MPLLDLPNEVFLLVAQYLTLDECKQLRLLHRGWGALLRPFVFRQLVLDRIGKPATVPGLYTDNDLVAKILARLPQLRDDESIEDDDELQESAGMPSLVGRHLQDLAVLDASVNLEQLCLLVHQCDQIRSLTLSYHAMCWINWRLLDRSQQWCLPPRPYSPLKIHAAVYAFFAQLQLDRLVLVGAISNRQLLVCAMLPTMSHLRHLDMLAADMHELDVDFFELIQNACPMLESIVCPAGIRMVHHLAASIEHRHHESNSTTTTTTTTTAVLHLDTLDRLAAQMSPWPTMRQVDIRVFDVTSWVLFFLFLAIKMPALRQLHLHNLAHMDQSRAAVEHDWQLCLPPMHAVAARFALRHLTSMYIDHVPMHPMSQGITCANKVMHSLRVRASPTVLSMHTTCFDSLAHLVLVLESHDIERLFVALNNNNQLTNLAIHASVTDTRKKKKTNSNPLRLDVLLRKCTRLRRLTVYGVELASSCLTFASSSLLSLPSSTHPLQELVLAYTQLPPAVLATVSQQCPHLDVLQLRHVQFLHHTPTAPKAVSSDATIVVPLHRTRLVSLRWEGTLPKHLIVKQTDADIDNIRAWHVLPSASMTTPRAIVADLALARTSPPWRNAMVIVCRHVASFKVAHFQLISSHPIL
ncbi:hypothetical protein BC940DRAFT_310669, partial [Gongronella butleri]